MSVQRNGGVECEFEIAPGVKMVMCWIPPGEFLMGSPEKEDGHFHDETQHRVRITQGFWLAKTQTTQAQWLAVMGDNPSHFQGEDLPVECVSWEDICGNESGTEGFLRGINKCVSESGRFYLPTEAQWEYACRAGTTGPYAGNLDEMGWYSDNSDSKTHPVGHKKPNAWGLHDMLGNVWEWCADWYEDYDVAAVTDPAVPASGSFRVFRGGSWRNSADSCRAACRANGNPSSAYYSFGLRLARSSDPPYTEKSNDPIFRPASALINLSKSGSAMSVQRNGGVECEFEIAPGVKMVMCWIPPGEFLMGSPEKEDGHFHDETQHRVRITQGFWLAETQTTQAQWLAVMGYNPSHFQGKEFPIEKVNWNDICGNRSGIGGFLGELNKCVSESGRFYLPTEAQWEYACRAGTTGPYAGNLDEMGWYSDNSDSKTHPVGHKKPNAWGLHDMHGNVWEWCADWYGDYDLSTVMDPTGPANGSFRVFRGGSWHYHAAGCRAANRGFYNPNNFLYRDCDMGFRIAYSSIP